MSDEEPLGERVSAIEQQLAELVAHFRPGEPTAAKPPAGDLYWALNGLRERAGDEGSGAVLYTGTVDLPTGEHYDWQYALTVDDLMAGEWPDSSGTLGALGHPVRLQLLRRILGGVHTTADLAADEALGTTGQL